MNKFVIEVINNEYSNDQQVITGKSIKLPDEIIAINNPAFVEVRAKGLAPTVMVIKNNLRRFMGDEVKPAQVSWMAAGPQSAESARLYAAAISAASTICREIDLLKDSVSAGG